MNLRAFLPLFLLGLEGFTVGAIGAVSAAWRLAAAGGRQITPEHLLAGMATSNRSLATLGRLGFDLHDRAADILDLAGPSPPDVARRCRGFSPETRGIITAALGESRRLGCRHVGVEHLVLSLLSGPGCRAADYLRGRGITEEAIRTAVTNDRA